ncbi:MAG: TIGR01212 family radical SAM protein [Candidatus Aminicenantia bacterium]
MRPYNSFNSNLRKIFGERVQKIPVDAGFFCPNKDGKLSTKGCIFCDSYGAGSVKFAGLPLNEQIERGIKKAKEKYGANLYIVYFQAHTNTYCKWEKLKEYIDIALSYKGVIGISIGTRPDTLADDILDGLSELSKTKYLWLELGLQSIHEKSLKFLNRNHSFEDFHFGYKRAKERKIQVCAHIILGIPGESREDTIETAKYLAKIEIDGVKIHPLHVLKGTELQKIYDESKIKLLEKDEYVKLVVDFIEHLHPSTIIHRITGEREQSHLIAPLWVLKKSEIITEIEREFERRKSYQGIHFRL